MSKFIGDHPNMIDDVLNVIADERMKIAELEMLLTGD